MFDYAGYIFWAYFLVIVPMIATTLILFYTGNQIKKNIRNS